MADDNINILTRYSQFLDASGEHLTYAALSAYRNSAGELSQKERIFFRRHLDSCRECSARLNEVGEVESIENEGVKNAVMPFAPAVIRYAIAAVMVVAVGIAILVVFRDTPRGKTLTQERPADLPPAVAAYDPEKFVPDQVLENFVDRKVRSASGLKLTAPGIGDTVIHPVVFTWESKKAGSMFTLTIVNNRSFEVWKEQTTSAVFTLDKKLEPGLYYVKLETNGTLVQVGKFVVVR